MSEWHEEEMAEMDAVLRVVEAARDRRRPAPPLDVVAPEELHSWGDADALATLVGDVPSLLGEFLESAGAKMSPRLVRVDSGESYAGFRSRQSPEIAALAARVAKLEADLSLHLRDPEAHSTLTDEVREISILGVETKEAEQQKRIELVTPERFEGVIEAWLEGENVCASLILPGSKIRICTSMTPLRKCIAEIEEHAAASGVSPTDVAPLLPGMGAILGAGTVLKEMAAGAKDIARRKEMKRDVPFLVGLRPKTDPIVAALALLALACRAGNASACVEWKAVTAAAPPFLKEKLARAIELAKKAS